MHNDDSLSDSRCSDEESVPPCSDAVEVSLPQNINPIGEQTLFLLGGHQYHGSECITLTVRPTCSWKAALAALRIWTSRSNKATVTNCLAKSNAYGTKVFGACALASDQRT